MAYATARATWDLSLNCDLHSKQDRMVWILGKPWRFQGKREEARDCRSSSRGMSEREVITMSSRK